MRLQGQQSRPRARGTPGQLPELPPQSNGGSQNAAPSGDSTSGSGKHTPCGRCKAPLLLRWWPDAVLRCRSVRQIGSGCCGSALAAQLQRRFVACLMAVGQKSPLHSLTSAEGVLSVIACLRQLQSNANALCGTS